MFITNSFSLGTSAKTTSKTTSWINSCCLTVFWEKVDGTLYLFSTTIISSECNYLAFTIGSNIFWYETSSLATLLILLPHYQSIYSFLWTALLLVFQTFYFTDLWSVWTLFWNFCVTVNQCSKLLVFLPFWMLWKLVRVNNLNHTANIRYANTGNAGLRFLLMPVPA